MGLKTITLDAMKLVMGSLKDTNVLMIPTEPSKCDTICGDKFILWEEDCDDGADKDGKGCADGCKSKPRNESFLGM